MSNHVEFSGRIHPIPARGTLTLGRQADVVIDEANPYLHRRFLAISQSLDLVWLENLGQIEAVVAAADGLVQARLSPGARLPAVFGQNAVSFSAGPTSYSFTVVVGDPPYLPSGTDEAGVEDTIH